LLRTSNYRRGGKREKDEKKIDNNTGIVPFQKSESIFADSLSGKGGDWARVRRYSKTRGRALS